MASTPSRGVYSDTAYGPYGEAYAQSGTTDLSFTGMNQDTVPNLYDFPAREYGIQGRWPSPDPAGLAAVDLSDPQTLNRYAYVRNSPLELVDPLGLMCNLVDPDGGTSCNVGGVEFDLGFVGGGGPVGIPGPPPIGTTAPTFPTASGIDWTSVIFGPPDPSLLIYSWCLDKSSIHIVACNSGTAETNCGSYLACVRRILGIIAHIPLSSGGHKSQSPAPQQPCAPRSGHPSMGDSGSVSTVNPLTSGGGGVWGANWQSFGATTNKYTYSGKGLGLDIGASVESVWAWGSGSWTGPFHSIRFAAGPFAGSIFWTPGKGGWTGLSFGLGLGPPGVAYEGTYYTCRSAQ